MGEIIDFFAHGMSREEAEARKKRYEERFPDLPDQEEIIDRDKLIKLIELVTRLLSTATGDPNREAYQVKYDLVETYPNEQIIEWINYSDARDVAKQPLFYRALIDVARKRKLFSENHD